MHVKTDKLDVRDSSETEGRCTFKVEPSRRWGTKNNGGWIKGCEVDSGMSEGKGWVLRLLPLGGRIAGEKGWRFLDEGRELEGWLIETKHLSLTNKAIQVLSRARNGDGKAGKRSRNRSLQRDLDPSERKGYLLREPCRFLTIAN